MFQASSAPTNFRLQTSKSSFFLSLILIFCCPLLLSSCIENLINIPRVTPKNNFDESLKSYNDFYNAAECYLKDGKVVEALKHAKKAISIDPTEQVAYSTAGISCIALGLPSEARHYFKKSLSINTNSQESSISKRWIEILNHPRPIALVPFRRLSPNVSSRVANECSDILKSYFISSGIYNVIEIKPSRNASQIGMCNASKKKKAKYTVLTYVSDFELEKNSYTPFIRVEGRRYYKFNSNIKASLQVFETKKCSVRMTKTRNTGIFDQDLGDIDKDQVRKLVIKEAMHNLFIDVNMALLKIGE